MARFFELLLVCARMRLPAAWSMQLASDVIRDGLGLELIDSDDVARVEVFRCDADNTVTISYAPGPHAPSDVVSSFFDEAAVALDTFEDGSPLPPREKWLVSG